MHRKVETKLNIQHLQVLFHEVSPEYLIESLFMPHNSPFQTHDKRSPSIHSSVCNMETYRLFALDLNRRYSHSEVDLAAKDLQQKIEKSGYGSTIFSFLATKGAEILCFQQKTPVYRYEYTLAWRDLTRILGQELIVSAFLAHHDLKYDLERDDFCWTSAIHSDNHRLQQILSQGMSENHFHLNGSAPVFLLSWTHLMNFPRKGEQVLTEGKSKHEFQQTLSTNKTQVSSNISIQNKIYLASFLRGRLFEDLRNKNQNHTLSIGEFKSFFDSLGQISQVNTKLEPMIAELRHSHGLSVSQSDGPVVLDYALTKGETESVATHHNRLFVGERKFLYEMFRESLAQCLSKEQEDLFYVYLLLKHSLYKELVQVNGRRGFENFLLYQNRKEFFYENTLAYKEEAQRIAIYGALQDQPIVSLEARVSFRKTPKEQFHSIQKSDKYFLHAKETHWKHFQEEDYFKEDFPFFYVLHFIKEPNKSVEKTDLYQFVSLKPRNADVRHTIFKQACSLEQALREKPYLRKRILGIDACSREIGCRPETFATEFRFLRQESRNFQRKTWEESKFSPVQCHGLGGTFHAGEDFLDLIDGLRAIDETIQFLEWERGDRLGHALALGISPEEYYSLKENRVLLPKQDLLDNLVWFLYRCFEFDLEIPSKLERSLRKTAENLFSEQYGALLDKKGSMLDFYFQSWKLRGDHPDIFLEEQEEPFWLSSSQNQYRHYKKRKGLEDLRGNPIVVSLCRGYHFNQDVRDWGEETETWVFPDELPSIVRKLQDKIQYDIARKGFSLECNPTSNVLIGTFDQYTQHPLFRFNNYGISHWNPQETSHHLSVSINTDDLGVFSSSLENEYALIAYTLELEKQDVSLTSEEVYQYVDYLRRLGNAQSFLKKAPLPLP